MPRQARVGVAWDDGVHDHLGRLTGDKIAKLVQAGEKVLGQAGLALPLLHFLRHDAKYPNGALGVKYGRTTVIARDVRGAHSVGVVGELWGLRQNVEALLQIASVEEVGADRDALNIAGAIDGALAITGARVAH